MAMEKVLDLYKLCMVLVLAHVIINIISEDQN